MSKELTPLEAFEKILGGSCGEEMYVEKEIHIVEKQLKALEIIKQKRVDVDLFYTVIEDKNQEDKLWSYNFWFEDKYKLTKEEFDLLKEVLL